MWDEIVMANPRVVDVATALVVIEKNGNAIYNLLEKYKLMI